VQVASKSLTMPKTHDREFFYKFYTCDTAKVVLSKLEVRWSSPLTFNDPFDTQFDLNVKFDGAELDTAFREKLKHFVMSDDEPAHPLHPRFDILLKQMRQLRDRVPWDTFEQQISSANDRGFTNMQGAITDSNSQWKSYLAGIRMYCVSEIHDDLLMWAHYAKNHTGVVLKFRCIAEKDTALCAARPVTYRDDIPLLATKDEWIADLFGVARMDLPKRFTDMAFIKSIHWSYEKEWRAVAFLTGKNDELYSTYNIWPNEIDAVYLGCRISEEDREDITRTVGATLKHVKIFEAKANCEQFALDFRQIT